MYPDGWAEDIVKLLSRPGSAMILAFVPKRTDTQLQGNPSSGALILNTRGGKIDF